MQWYLAKFVYHIISGDGNHKPQFDEQLRLIAADDETHALNKAQTLGLKEQDCFLNQNHEHVKWKFINISGLYELGELSDGMEMYSCIKEEDNAEDFIRVTNLKASYLLLK